MRNNIVDFTSEKDYSNYLIGLESSELLNELYACHRQKKAVKSKLRQVCKEVYNNYCSLLVDIDYDNITSFDAYLLRLFWNFKIFVSRQFQHINELSESYDPRPIHSLKTPEFLDSSSVLKVYCEVKQEYYHLEKIVSSFEEKTNIWMYHLFGKGDIPEKYKTEEYKKSICAVNEDGSYDFRYQLELVYKELVKIIENEMNCDISVFKDKGYNPIKRMII